MNKNTKNPDKYFNWGAESGAPTSVGNTTLVCKDCIHKIEVNTSQCEVYVDRKPVAVLYGKDCDLYEKE